MMVSVDALLAWMTPPKLPDSVAPGRRCPVCEAAPGHRCLVVTPAGVRVLVDYPHRGRTS